MGSFARASAQSAFALFCVLGCGGGSTPGADAAVSDSGGPADTGAGDTGAARDSGTDAPMPQDSGPPRDSGPPPDGCALTFARCTALEDRTGEATVVITIPSGTLTYDPPCIRVSAGTVVTIPGTAAHPLLGASCSPSGSPIPRVATVTDGDYTLAAQGAYGYYCNFHGANSGAGMAGLIVVE